MCILTFLMNRAVSTFLDMVIEILLMSVSPDDPQPHSDLTRSPTLQRCQSSSFTFTENGSSKKNLFADVSSNMQRQKPMNKDEEDNFVTESRCSVCIVFICIHQSLNTFRFRCKSCLSTVH